MVCMGRRWTLVAVCLLQGCLHSCVRAASHAGRYSSAEPASTGNGTVSETAVVEAHGSEDSSLEQLLHTEILGVLHAKFEVSDLIWIGGLPQSQHILKILSQQSVRVVSADPDPALAQYGSQQRHIAAPLTELLDSSWSAQYDAVVALFSEATQISDTALQEVLQAAAHALRSRGWLILGRMAGLQLSEDLGPHFRPAQPGSIPHQLGSEEQGWSFRLYRKRDAAAAAATQRAQDREAQEARPGSQQAEELDLRADSGQKGLLQSGAPRRVQMPVSRLGHHVKIYGHSLRRL